MILKSFPGCCTAMVVVGFGETETADYDIRPEENNLSVEEIKRYIGTKLNSFAGMAMLTCTTNNEQINANQALEECGFLSSDWMDKKAHPETKVKLWWFPLMNKQVNG